MGGNKEVTVNGSPRRKKQYTGLNLHHIDNTRIVHDINHQQGRFLSEKQIEYDITDPKVRESYEKIKSIDDDQIKEHNKRFDKAGVKTNIYHYLEEAPVYNNPVVNSPPARLDQPVYLNPSHRRIMNDHVRLQNHGSTHSQSPIHSTNDNILMPNTDQLQ